MTYYHKFLDLINSLNHREDYRMIIQQEELQILENHLHNRIPNLFRVVFKVQVLKHSSKMLWLLEQNLLLMGSQLKILIKDLPKYFRKIQKLRNDSLKLKMIFFSQVNMKIKTKFNNFLKFTELSQMMISFTHWKNLDLLL